MFNLDNIEYLVATRPAFLAGMIFATIGVIVFVIVPLVKLIGLPVTAVLGAGIENLF